MDDPVVARQAFVQAQVAALQPLEFVVVGLPAPPFDAIQVRLEEAGEYVVEIAARDPSAPFADTQQKSLGDIGFSSGAETWVGPTVTSPAAAVDVVERVLVEVLDISPTTSIDVRHGTLREERAAEAKLASMREFIEPVLEAMLGHEAPKDTDGDYLVDLGGSRVFVAPRAAAGRPPIIRVFAITNAGLNLTADLGLFLARLNFSLAFGRFSIDTDHRAVWFDETLLGDQVTAEELTFVVHVVATTAAEWDEKIAAMFGGTFGGVPGADAATEAVTEGGEQQQQQSPRPSKPGEGGYL